ncbi:g007 [Yersinia phage phiR1-37]|uniref:hypothetical protein n=1 Tax=Yersinia phage phiR1-37 TaxID=331278 RepID=UPI00022DBCB3|nr:hypothetical protein phiR1-37_gp007 [Yersinia phage phiR1-37]CCE26031.1 g007 [Yersinia phage phiR1-37]
MKTFLVSKYILSQINLDAKVQKSYRRELLNLSKMYRKTIKVDGMDKYIVILVPETTFPFVIFDKYRLGNENK